MKLKSYFLLNFEDKLSPKPWIWHRCDASSDASFYPLRLGPININFTQSASEKDNRKKKHPHSISAWLLTSKVAFLIIYLIILRGGSRINSVRERDGM